MGQIVSQQSDVEYIIYTITGCEYCRKVKELLQHNSKSFNDVNCDEQLLNNKTQIFYLVEHETGQKWSTFPIVYRKQKFIGGYTETANYIEMEKRFSLTIF